MESWRIVWRKGAKFISILGLEALRDALEKDDPSLLQGGTLFPPPLHSVGEWEVKGACPLAYTGWKGDELQTVGEVEEYFAYLCTAVDQELGEPGGIRWLLNWIDETDRKEMRESLLEEVNLSLSEGE
jgi:hypothetical protein